MCSTETTGLDDDASGLVVSRPRGRAQEHGRDEAGVARTGVVPLPGWRAGEAPRVQRHLTRDAHGSDAMSSTCVGVTLALAQADQVSSIKAQNMSRPTREAASGKMEASGDTLTSAEHN